MLYDSESDIEAETRARVRALRKKGKNGRLRAVRELEAEGASAVPVLCVVLSARDSELRAAAAAALGRIGDSRALPALARAFRRSLVGRSARRQVLTGIGVAAGILLAILALAPLLLKLFNAPLVADRELGWQGLVVLFVAIAGALYVERVQSAGKACEAIMDALQRIAAVDATPELRELLPDLGVVAGDVLQQEGGTRSAARKTAAAIEAATTSFKNLPLPSNPASPDDTTLPRPARAPAPHAATLPRVNDSGD